MKHATYEETIRALENRGVVLMDLAQIIYDMQIRYAPDLTIDECYGHLLRVLDKREVQHAVLTGINLDILAEKGLLEEPLQSIVERDEGLFGVDEILALSIVNCYGSIGLTNFGWLDKEKIGIIGEFDSKKQGSVHTFLDDILCALCASACSRLAHQQVNKK
ncbi:phosphatidylglycerophosphatase A [Priestia megaterium]|nr:phosphatidylglycerophosphatase A [Priestia megaterium]